MEFEISIKISNFFPKANVHILYFKNCWLKVFYEWFLGSTLTFLRYSSYQGKLITL